MMKWGLLALVVIHIVISSAAAVRAQDALSSIFIAETIHSRTLGEERPLSIYLPEDYATSGKSYPVLYLLDGESHIFHVTGLVKYLVSVGRIPELIVVGIHSIDRYRDYTPDEIEHHPGTGGAAHFTGFLTEELFDHIESSYRTRPFRIIFGHSYGGTYVTHIFLNEPGMFGGYVAASPNLLVLDDVLGEFETRFAQPDTGRQMIFLTVGEYETDFMTLASDLAARASDKPQARRLWNYQILAQDNHASTPHKTVYFGLETIFKGFWQFDSETDGPALVEQFRTLSDRLGYDVEIPLPVLVSLGNSALGSERLDQAQSIFEMVVESYPESEWGYVSLGSVHYSKEDMDRAAMYFGMALSINPDNPYTLDMLRALTPQSEAIQESEGEQLLALWHKYRTERSEISEGDDYDMGFQKGYESPPGLVDGSPDFNLGHSDGMQARMGVYPGKSAPGDGE